MLTFLSIEEINQMDSWEGSQLNTAKEILAYELTKMVHGEEEAKKAQETARALFAQGGSKENMPATALTSDDLQDGAIGILNLMVKCGLCASNGEARRLVQQGGVSVNDQKVTDPKTTYTADALSGEGIVLKKGKKIYHRATLG
jgi:tyrosyl-tRNA synthetase